MSDELYHSGVKGRSGRYPWGSGEDPYQRITRGSGSAKSKNQKIQKEIKKNGNRIASQKKTTAKNKEKKRIDEDSLKKYKDEELRNMISRLRLENEYKTLTSQLNPKQQSWGKKFLKEVGGSILKQSVKDVGGQVATYFLGEGINKATGMPIYVRKKGK